MILVTGATGTNGRLVVQTLLKAGRPVRAMVQDPTGAADLQQAGAQLVGADFDTADTLDAALAGVERVLLLSPVDQRLVEREARFVERATKAGLKHLVKFSAIGAHPAASFTWGRQHGVVERLVMDGALPFTFVQPNFFMQNLLWSAETIKTRGELYSSFGSTPASHVDARDIAAVIAATLTEPLDRHAGRIHLVTGPAAITFDQIAEACSVAGGNTRPLRQPHRRAAEGRAHREWPARLAGRRPDRAQHLRSAGPRVRGHRHGPAHHGAPRPDAGTMVQGPRRGLRP